MSDRPDNLVLHRLDLIFRQNNRVLEQLDRLVGDTRDLKLRMTAVEEGVTGVNRRLDRHEDRLDRIERRLEIVPAI